MPADVLSNPFADTPEGLRVLAFGDVVGTAGVRGLCETLPSVIAAGSVDLVIANGENANGFGLLPANATRLFQAGVSVITGGNHTFRPSDALELLKNNPHVLRPHNLAPDSSPGSGVVVVSTRLGPVAVLNLAGQVFMDPADNPFHALETILATMRANNIRMILVDFHAEATGEKTALAYFADGKVSLVVGTHTHVPTADARILPNRTGFITDLGMCGSQAGIIGMEPGTILRRHLTGLYGRYQPDTRNCHIQGIAAVIAPDTGHCLFIKRVEWSA